MAYEDYCNCLVKDIKNAEERNLHYRLIMFNEAMGGSHKSYLIHKLIGHSIVEEIDCSPVGMVEVCSCGKRWAS